MSYESLCNQLYLDRLAAKTKKDKMRKEFRDMVLNRHIEKINKELQTVKTEIVQINENFVMPDVLPTENDKLKWLIFQNIELIKNSPDRKQEAELNIKLIKQHIKSL